MPVVQIFTTFSTFELKIAIFEAFSPHKNSKPGACAPILQLISPKVALLPCILRIEPFSDLTTIYSRRF